MLQRNSENKGFSEDEELLTASNTDHVSINFLCHRQTEARNGESFPYLLSPIPLLSLNVQFCFNEPGYTLCLLLRSNHIIRVYLTHL